MAEYTENYNLEKPAEDDYYDVGVFNGNADIIDTALLAKMERDEPQQMTAALRAMASPAEGAAQVRNSVVVAKGTNPATLNVPVGTLIFVKE